MLSYRLFLLCSEKPLAVLVTHIFDLYDFFSHLSIPRADFCRAMSLLEDGYNDVPYHNHIHAADVVHNLFWMVQSPTISQALTKLDIAVALVSCAMHDFGELCF